MSKKLASKGIDGLPDILPPKNDFVFKALFGDEENKEILIAFLEAVLVKSISDLYILDPINKKRSKDDKLSILDVKVKLANGEIITIEMQVRQIAQMRSRITFCSARAVADQLKSGKDYSELKPVVSIIIMGETLIHESNKCHNVFLTMERDEHFVFNDLQETHVLDLTRIKNEKSETLSDWLSFINSEKEEDFMKIAKKNPMINNAFVTLKRISSNDTQRRLYLARLIQQTDALTGENEARREGLKEMFEFLRQGHSFEDAEKRFFANRKVR